MSDFLVVKNLHKTFRSRKQTVEVLKGIDLSIEKGEIFGVVGYSGAGKSTLVRCINRLEEPDEGSVLIGGVDVTALKKSELNRQRRKIGMIFQQFNLFDSMTARQNIAYSLKNSGMTEKEKEERISEMLELVSLTDKRDAYPGELSGGQKQRVGIARALANRPDVLLSDEATSALDPQTTLSVLDLLLQINKKLGLTILMITHELEVVKYTCRRMAVMEQGRFVEQGLVSDIFRNPVCDTAKGFIEVYNRFRSDTFSE
ncbi:MAG: ATP-binding cassette domain-containing protein [Lachnospiraceae bacterium]|nr:ATP-binding cassette domain-containing protein [Lachnospiraceae bacterium]